MINKILPAIVLLSLNVLGQNSLDHRLENFADNKKIAMAKNYRLLAEKAMISFRTGEYNRAAKIFADAALAAPRHPLPNFYLACSLIELKQYDIAAKVMLRTVSLYDDWQNIPLDFQKILSQKTWKDFSRWISGESRTTGQYFLFGFLCQYSGENNKAEVYYRLAVTRSPPIREAYLFLEMLLGQKITAETISLHNYLEKGQEAIKQKKYLVAIDIWSEACIEYVDSPIIYYHLGYSLAAAGYFQQASEILQAAIKKAPDYLSQSLSKHRFYIRNHSEFLLVLENKLQTNKNDVQLLFLLSYFCLSDNKHDKAKKLWSKASKMLPELDTLKSFGKALEQPEQELPLKAQETHKDIALAKKLFADGKWRESAKILGKVAERNPNNNEVYWLLALTTFADGQYSYSAKFMKVVLRTSHVPQWQKYYRKRSDFERQVNRLETWVQKHEIDNDALFVSAMILLGDKKKKQAHEIFTVLRKKLPKDPDIEYAWNLSLNKQNE